MLEETEGQEPQSEQKVSKLPANLDFGAALKWLKQDAIMRRACWGNDRAVKLVGTEFLATEVKFEANGYEQNMAATWLSRFLFSSEDLLATDWEATQLASVNVGDANED